MIKKLPLVVLLFQFAVQAQEPIFNPSSTISSFGSVSSPAGENYTKIIDGNEETKFLDFNYTDGLGFTVNLNGVQKTAVRMDITTANDSPERDPMNYQIYGSTNGINYTLITNGSIVCNSTRFNTTSHNFSNTGAYSYYRLVFLNQCNSIEAMLQIAEVQLFHSTLNTTEFNKNIDFALYPNPNNGLFTVTSNTNQSIDLVTVIDALGKQIKQIHFNASTSTELNLQDVAAGVYFIQVTSGSESAVKRVLIH